MNERRQKMSLYGDIKKKIQDENIFNVQNNWWTKRSWNKVDIKDFRIRKVSKEMRDFIELKQKKFNKITSSKKNFQFRKETAIGNKRYNKIKEKKCLEEALERMLIASCGDLYNQFNILSGVMKGQARKSIDIVVRCNDMIETMFELKDWNNKADNPISAAFELLFDYFIYKELLHKEIKTYNDRSPWLLTKPVKLIVLAPESYYERFGNIGKLRLAEKYINRFVGKKEITFSFRKIPIDINILKAIHEGDLMSDDNLSKENKNVVRNAFLKNSMLFEEKET